MCMYIPRDILIIYTEEVIIRVLQFRIWSKCQSEVWVFIHHPYKEGVCVFTMVIHPGKGIVARHTRYYANTKILYLQCHTIQYHTILYYTIPYMQRNTTQHGSQEFSHNHYCHY